MPQRDICCLGDQTRRRPLLTCTALLLCCVLPYLDLPVVCLVLGLDSFKIPGHALLEKGLHKQKGAGPLVSSQERRASVPCKTRVQHEFCP